jgi:phosphopantothenoylcysteine decarboxylase
MSNILIHISGSISAYKACSLASALKKQGHEVQCTATKGALHFIGPASIEGITGRPLLTDVFAGGETGYIPHISLSQQWADLILVYPASANVINRLAAGLSDDLFGAIFLANNFNKPLWIAPAMNSQMLLHPATQESLKKLEGWGCSILPSDEGLMACGTKGPGRLLEPLDVAARIEEFL